MTEILNNMLSREQQQRLEAQAPTHFTAPTGSRIRIDYRDEACTGRCRAITGAVRATRLPQTRRGGASNLQAAVAGAATCADHARSGYLLAGFVRRKCARTCAAVTPGTTGPRTPPAPNRPAAPSPPQAENPKPDGLPRRIATCDYGSRGRCRITGRNGFWATRRCSCPGSGCRN